MFDTILPILSISIGCIILLTITHLIFDKLLLRKKNLIHIKFFRSILNTAIVIISIYACLAQFDITKDISKTIFQSGTLIIAILSFAAQQALGNIISGFSISLSKPFEVGQKIKIMSGNTAMVEGYITDITIRHTIIRQYDGQSCIVPNSIMDNSVIINSNYEGDIGNFLEIEISYDSDVNKAILIFHDICMSEPLCVNQGRASILVSKITKDGIMLKTTIWTKTLDDNFRACSKIRKALVHQFQANGIRIPYQTISIEYEPGTGSSPQKNISMQKWNRQDSNL